MSTRLFGPTEASQEPHTFVFYLSIFKLLFFRGFWVRETPRTWRTPSAPWPREERWTTRWCCCCRWEFMPALRVRVCVRALSCRVIWSISLQTRRRARRGSPSCHGVLGYLFRRFVVVNLARGKPRKLRPFTHPRLSLPEHSPLSSGNLLVCSRPGRLIPFDVRTFTTFFHRLTCSRPGRLTPPSLLRYLIEHTRLFLSAG